MMAGIMGDPHLPREPMGDRGWHGKKRKPSKWERQVEDDSWRVLIEAVALTLVGCVLLAVLVGAVVVLWRA